MTEFAKGGYLPPGTRPLDLSGCVQDGGNAAKPYGDVSFMVEFRVGSGRVVTVTHADEVIGVSMELLDTGDVTVAETGLLTLDTAGEYVYRPVRFAEQGRVVVCERVR